MNELLKMLIDKRVEIEVDYEGQIGIVVLDEQDWNNIFQALREKECKVMWRGEIFP